MTVKKDVTTKSGEIITEAYCRRCMKILPVDSFYNSVDLGKIDSNNLMSICKDCVNSLYDEEYSLCKSVEEAIHKVCMLINLSYNPDAVESTKTHINTMMEGGYNPPPIFSTYKSKLLSHVPLADRGEKHDFTYKHADTVYVVKDPAVPVKIVPKELREFWGEKFTTDEIEFLEREFANAKQTHKADTWAEIVLLKEVCYSMLEIKKEREAPTGNIDIADSVKGLQTILKSLGISPNAVTGATKGSEAFGLWISDIERYEPAEWLKEDGEKYSMYADVDNVEEYFQKYFVRPLKNFITGSRDFNIGEDENEADLFADIEEETNKPEEE